MRIAYPPIALALVLTISCSSGGKLKPSISFDETPLSDNSSTLTIMSDLRQWSAVAGSWSVMCKVARLTVDRRFKYFYIDERRKPADGQPSFRITFYKTPPEGIPVIHPMKLRDPSEAAGAMDSAMDAEEWIEACNLYESQSMR